MKELFGTLQLAGIKPGDFLEVDGGFTCVPEGQVVQVLQDGDGLFFVCSEGQHYLDGQKDEKGFLVGVRASSLKEQKE